MRQSVKVIIHIGYWILYLLLLTILLLPIWLNNFENTNTVYFKNFQSFILFSPLSIMALLPGIVSFYCCYFLLFEKFLIPRKYGLLTIFFALTCLTCSLCGYGCLLLLPKNGVTINENANGIMAALIVMSFIALVHGIIALIIRVFFQYHTETKLREVLQQKHFETELALIRYQLDPHFLFNTLNNIDILISKDYTLASRYLNKLSALLRFMLYETKTDFISLEKEISCITEYIELQKLRFSNKDYVHYSFCSPIDSYMNAVIPPMLLIPFIENSFKHATILKQGTGISIQIDIRDEKLFFSCSNSFSENPKVHSSHAGIGNDLTQKRLRLLYNNDFCLSANKENERYQVNLSLPLYATHMHHH